MAVAEWQAQINGLLIGRGTIYRLEDVRGLGLGDKRSRRYPKPGEDGLEWGREWRDGPVLTLEGKVRTPGDPAAAWAGFMALRDAFNMIGGGGRRLPRTTTDLILTFPGSGELTIPGRPDRFDANTLTQLAQGFIPWTGTFECATEL